MPHSCDREVHENVEPSANFKKPDSIWISGVWFRIQIFIYISIPRLIPVPTFHVKPIQDLINGARGAPLTYGQLGVVGVVVVVVVTTLHISQ